MGVFGGVIEGVGGAQGPAGPEGPAGGSGDVVGPGAATDNAFVRFDSTTGKLIQNGVVTGDDAGAISGVTQLTVDNLRLDGNTLSSQNANGNITIDPNGTGTVIVPAALFSKSFIDPHTQADDPVDLQSASSGGVATNASSTGSLSFNLPGAPTLGDVFSFAVVAAQNLVVQAQGTQVIKAGATTSTVGGTFTSSTVGSFLRIIYVDTDLWMGLSSGTWVGA